MFYELLRFVPVSAAALRGGAVAGPAGASFATRRNRRTRPSPIREGTQYLVRSEQIQLGNPLGTTTPDVIYRADLSGSKADTVAWMRLDEELNLFGKEATVR